MLVDELSEALMSQGIFTEERLETLIKKFDEFDSQNFQNFSLREYEGFEKKPFKFTSRFLAQEIIKRKNDFETRPLHHKQLTKMLGDLLEKENKCTFLSVIVKYNYNVKDIPAKELVMALDNYKDPFNITQENLWYMLNNGKKFDELWTKIMEICDDLNLDQVVSLIRSMNTIHTYLGKKHSYYEPIDPIVKNLFGDTRFDKKKPFNKNSSLKEPEKEEKKEEKIEERKEEMKENIDSIQGSEKIIDETQQSLKEKISNFEEFLKYSRENENIDEKVKAGSNETKTIEETIQNIEKRIEKDPSKVKNKKSSKKKQESIKEDNTSTGNTAINQNEINTNKNQEIIDKKVDITLESEKIINSNKKDFEQSSDTTEKNQGTLKGSEKSEIEKKLSTFKLPEYFKKEITTFTQKPRKSKTKVIKKENFIFGDVDIKMYPINPGENVKEDFIRDINPKDTNHIPEEYIEKLLSRFLELENEANFQKICLVLDNARELFPQKITENMKKVQIALVEYPIFPDRFKPSELASIVKNFPENALELNEDLVNSLGKKVEKIFPDLSHPDKIEVFKGMHRAKLKISGKIGNSLEELDIEFLESLSSEKVLEFYSDLADSEILTENLSQTILESFLWNMKITTESFEKMADIIYKVHNKGYTSFLFNEPNYLLRVSHPCASMNLEATLKFSIVYISNWSNYEIYNLLLDAFIRSAEYEDVYVKNLELIAEVQAILLRDSQEQPIYNYQIDSYSYIFHAQKKELIDHIYKIMKTIDPGHPLVWQYYAEFLEPQKPEDSEFLNKVNDKNLLFVCKSLWRFRPGMETCNEIIKNVFDITSFYDKDYTEEIYYLAACKPVAELFDWKWVNQDSLFYLPLCFELGVKPVISDKLKESIKDNFVMFGEPLIKSLILSIKFKVNKEFVRNLSKNLSFIPRNEPKTDTKLIKTLTKSILKYNGNIDLFAFSIFVNKNFEIFEKNEILALANFFSPIINKVFPGLKESFELIGIYPSTNFLENPQNDYKTIALTQDFSENVKILKKIISLKTNNTIFFSQFLQDLQNSIDKSEVLEGIKVSLEFLSIYGNFNNSFEEIYKLLKKFQLWPLLSKDDLINFGFISNFSTHFLPTNATEYISPLLEYLKKYYEPLELQINSIGLHYYSPFTYKTTFEPRYLTSNDLALYNPKPKYNETQILESEFLKSIKIYYLLQKLNLPECPEITQTINSYFFKKSKLNDFIRGTLDIKAHGQAYFNFDPIEPNRDTVETPLTCLFHILLLFGDEGALMLLDSDMYILDAEDNIVEVALPIQKVIEDFEKLLGVNIQTYNIRAVHKRLEDKNHPFLEALKKKNFYY